MKLGLKKKEKRKNGLDVHFVSISKIVFSEK